MMLCGSMIIGRHRMPRDLHPADAEAIRLAREKRKAEPYPPLSDRQILIIESVFKRPPPQKKAS